MCEACTAVEARGVGCAHEIGSTGVRGTRGVWYARGGLGAVPRGAVLRRVVWLYLNCGMAVPIGCRSVVPIGCWSVVLFGCSYRVFLSVVVMSWSRPRAVLREGGSRLAAVHVVYIMVRYVRGSGLSNTMCRVCARAYGVLVEGARWASRLLVGGVDERGVGAAALRPRRVGRVDVGLWRAVCDSSASVQAGCAFGAVRRIVEAAVWMLFEDVRRRRRARLPHRRCARTRRPSHLKSPPAFLCLVNFFSYPGGRAL